MLSVLLARHQRNDPVPVYLFLMVGRAVCFSLFFTVQLIYHVTVVGLSFSSVDDSEVCRDA